MRSSASLAIFLAIFDTSLWHHTKSTGPTAITWRENVDIKQRSHLVAEYPGLKYVAPLITIQKNWPPQSHKLIVSPEQSNQHWSHSSCHLNKNHRSALSEIYQHWSHKFTLCSSFSSQYPASALPNIIEKKSVTMAPQNTDLTALESKVRFHTVKCIAMGQKSLMVGSPSSLDISALGIFLFTWHAH